jgi:hypothetical protein
MQTAAPRRLFRYRINADNRLEWVDSEWVSFARENDASHLTAEAVIGEPLFRFIDGIETRLLYQMILYRVRRVQQGVVIPFRCDSPSARRFMELDLFPYVNGAVQFSGRIVEEQERRSVLLLAPSVERTDGYVLMCSWCKRIATSGLWLDIEQAIRKLRLFDDSPLPKLTHGICEDCRERMLQVIDEPS